MARTTMNDLMQAMTKGFEGMNARMDGFEKRIEALESNSVAPKASKKSQPKAEKELVPFTKHDGSVVYGTAKQVEAWKKWQEGYKSPEERKARLEAWETKRQSYKPSKELVAAIKADRCAVTLKVAKTYGFIGTKESLKALKASICK